MLAVLLSPRVAPAQARGKRAVATENGRASREAMAVLRAGGNAVDAAVTAALVGGVASPTSSGIGGGGFAVVWDAKSKSAFVLDFRETAPKGIDTAAFEKRPLPWDERGKLTGVPGEVAGLHALHTKYGKKKWEDLVMPAANAARTGFSVERHLANMLAGRSQTKLRQDPGLAAVFYPGGKPVPIGRRIKNPKLAATLEAIAKQGPRAFYEGPIAEDIVASNRKAGGALTLADLKAYKPTERKPIVVSWEGHEVYTMPPPSAGGLMLAQTLKLFSKKELKKLGKKGPETGAYMHMVAEGLRGAIADRMRYLGDPDHQQVDLGKLLHDKRLAKRRASFALDRTHNIPRFGLEEHGTHHLVTADSDGNVVSLTTTVNRLFGAKQTAEKSGVVLNDELDDFTAKKGVAAFGMKESPNRPRPGARPVSSMTPTVVVKDGRAVLALGGSGGTTIATNTTQMVLSHLVFGQSPQKALGTRRFYTPTRWVYLALEKGAPKGIRADLEARGEIVGTMPFSTSAIQMVSIDGKGWMEAASDPRKGGTALVR